MSLDERKDGYLQKIPDLCWYLIRTMPKSERHVEAFFNTNGVPCYLPRCRRVYVNSFTGRNGKRYSYRRPPVLGPMFPCYIFAALGQDTIHDARCFRGVAQVCRHTNYTEDELLADLHKVQDFELLARTNHVEVRPEIQEGRKIMITHGIFKGWEGVVERRLDRNFIFVRIKTVGASIGVECAAVHCEIAE